MSLPRRMGRLARGLVLNLQEDERFRERLRVAGERGETLKRAFEAARKGAAEEWRRAEERRAEEQRAEGRRAGEGQPAGGNAAGGNAPGMGAGADAGADADGRRGTGGRIFGDRTSRWRRNATNFVPRKYPPNVLAAYDRLGLMPGAPMEEVDKKRRDLVKKYHPDRFPDPDKRARAEKITAEINAAHDAIERHTLRR